MTAASTEDDIDATATAPFQDRRADPVGFDGRPVLKVLSGPLLGRRIPLDFGEAVIGRADGLAVTLPDANVSREHAAIFFDGRAFRLVDRESRNGTLCNGERVEERVLAFGDRLRIGDSEMVFSCEGFELASSRPDQAAIAYARTLEREPNFLAAIAALRDLLAMQPDRANEVARLDRLLDGARRV